MKSFLLALELLLILAGIALIATNLLPFAILLLFVLAWVSLHLRHLGWRDVGLKRPAHILATIGLAILIGCGYQALDTWLIAPVLQRITGEAINLSQFLLLRGNSTALVFFLLITWTEAAFIEEMFFRGYMLNRLIDITGSTPLGITIALLGNAILFGLGHTYQGLTGVLDTALAGFLLAMLYIISRRNLWLTILTHGVIDTVGFVLLFLGLVR
jgi:membrane protease YdiL (CAAX protease family)